MSNFKFGTDEQTIQDSSGAPRLAYPALGRANLIDVEKRTIKNQQGEEFPNVLAFTFQFGKGAEDERGEPIKGHTIEKLEWEPREDDDQKKVDNKTGRVGYIMSKVMPKEDAIIDGSKIKSWEHFVDTVIERFEKNPGYKDVPLKVKVPASEYNGKVDFGIPNYKGFLETKESENPIAFSKKEEQANAKYVQSQQMQADTAPATEGGLPADADEDDMF